MREMTFEEIDSINVSGGRGHGPFNIGYGAEFAGIGAAVGFMIGEVAFPEGGGIIGGVFGGFLGNGFGNWLENHSS